MSLFDSFKKQKSDQPMEVAPQTSQVSENKDYAIMARLALDSIRDGFLVVAGDGSIKLINSAAIKMIGCKDEGFVLGLNLTVCMSFEDRNGSPIPENQNPFFHAVKTGQSFNSRDLILVSKENNKKYPVAINVLPTDSSGSDIIVTFRDIGDDLEEESKQSEFISTASHEMRTPVASIEGYLGLALNPQTATIDDRAKSYLEAAHKASQHLGRLFRDLLDVTKLDDNRAQMHLVPLELTDFVQQIVGEYDAKFKEKQLNYVFGEKGSNQGLKTMRQPVYVSADVDFLREIVTNLVENAIKYTPEGGYVWVNVKGDEKRAILSVADNGIGISTSDLEHVFQKFYRADNSQTREIGGTGLGLYLVKQRAESMDGNAWVESVFGKGSVFSVALPRISPEEYEKRKIILENELQAQKMQQEAQFREVSSFASRSAPTVATPIPQMPNTQTPPAPMQPMPTAIPQTQQVEPQLVQGTQVQPAPTAIPQTPLAQPVQSTPPGMPTQAAQTISSAGSQIQPNQPTQNQ